MVGEASAQAERHSGEMVAATSFRILGPIEAWSDERRLDIGGPKQLALLAMLLLRANHAVSTDALRDALWGADRSGSQNRLQMAVARLRKALSPLDQPPGSLLRTVAGGYLMSIDPKQIDAEVFVAAVAEGRRALEAGEVDAAARSLRDALALWRGQPLAEVSFEDFAQGEIRRLEELRLVALETRIEADLERGQHAELVGELQRLLVEHPTREPVAASLMRALYRCQRQADALEVYHQTRRILAEQLGLEPGPALKALQAEILTHAPSLAQSPHAGRADRRSGSESTFQPIRAPLPLRMQPHGPAVFVNRRRERAALDAAFRAAANGPQFVFVTGEAGIGKTRLVSELSLSAHAEGALVLAGRCDEALDLPYQPFVEALEHLVEHAPQQLLDAHVLRYGESLGRLVPALAPAAVDASPPASDAERYVLFRAIEGLLATASRGNTILLVIEDLHWADLPTLKLLRRLLAAPRSWPLMLLSTSRVGDLGAEHPVRELLASLHREPQATRIELEGLDEADVSELLGVIAEDPAHTSDRKLAATIQSNTSGNPFFITELVRAWMESGVIQSVAGRWELSAGVEIDPELPLSITETLERRIHRMPDDVRKCFEVAAVVGTEFALELIIELADVPVAEDALDVAVEAGVLVEVPGSPIRYRFAHALMRRYLYAELGPARRREMHWLVGSALEARLAGRTWPVAELAWHWVRAGDADSGKASRYASLAGDEAMSKLAPDEARRWYEIALDLLDRLPDRSERELCDLLIRRGEAERQAGDRRFRNTLLEAAKLAQRIGDERELVRAVLANTRGMQSETGVVDQGRVDMLDEALRIVPERDSPERALLLAMQAAELMYSPDWDRRVRLSDDALAMARRLTDVEALSTVLNLRFVSLLAPHTHSERSANSIEAVAAAERLNDPIALFYAYHWRGYACLEAGDVVGARTWMAREREIAERFRQPTALWLGQAGRANLAIVAGDLQAAATLAAEALHLGQQSEPDALACYAAQQAAIAYEAGQLGELVPILQQALAETPGVPGFRATLALALVEGSQADEAKEILDGEVASGFRELPYDVTWLAVVCIYARVSIQLADVDASRMLYRLLAPWHGQIVFPAFGVWGPAELYLGMLARVIGEAELAEGHLQRAAGAADRAAAPLWKARAEAELNRLAESRR